MTHISRFYKTGAARLPLVPPRADPIYSRSTTAGYATPALAALAVGGGHYGVTGDFGPAALAGASAGFGLGPGQLRRVHGPSERAALRHIDQLRQDIRADRSLGFDMWEFRPEMASPTLREAGVDGAFQVPLRTGSADARAQTLRDLDLAESRIRLHKADLIGSGAKRFLIPTGTGIGLSAVLQGVRTAEGLATDIRRLVGGAVTNAEAQDLADRIEAAREAQGRAARAALALIETQKGDVPPNSRAYRDLERRERALLDMLPAESRAAVRRDTDPLDDFATEIEKANEEIGRLDYQLRGLEGVSGAVQQWVNAMRDTSREIQRTAEAATGTFEETGLAATAVGDAAGEVGGAAQAIERTPEAISDASQAMRDIAATVERGGRRAAQLARDFFRHPATVAAGIGIATYGATTLLLRLLDRRERRRRRERDED